MYGMLKTMKKSEYLKELDRLQKEADELHERSELDLETAKFYDKQVDMLLSKANDESLDWQEKEEVMRQMESLLGKLNFEIRSNDAELPKMDSIRKQLEELQKVKETVGLTEG